MRKVYAVVPAAGSGTRMKNITRGRESVTQLRESVTLKRDAEKKQFMKLGGTEILVRSLQALSSLDEVKGIVVVTGRDEIERCRELCRSCGLDKVIKITEGAFCRQASVLNGLKALAEMLEDPSGKEDPIVLIHDAARPLVTEEEIRATIEAAEKSGAALLATKMKDTVKVAAKDGSVADTPDRNSLYSAMTPQTFRLGAILKAHLAAEAAGDFACTDDSRIMEKYGDRSVSIVEGSYENIKITTPVDLIIAEEILKERKEKGQHA